MGSSRYLHLVLLITGVCSGNSLALLAFACSAQAGSPDVRQESNPGLSAHNVSRTFSPIEARFLALTEELIARESLPEHGRALVPALVGELEQICKQRWRKCKVLPLGSYIYDLMLKGSDIDTSVVVPHGGHAHSVLSVLSELVRGARTYTSVIYLDRPIKPILHFYHRTYNFKFDVMANVDRDVQISELIKYLLRIDWRVYKLAFIVKHWAKVHNRVSRRLLRNYGMTCLVIFYLQQKNLLPPIAWLQDLPSHDHTWSWPTSFNRKHFTPSTDEPFNQLVGEFFTFYAQFDYDTNVISPFLGYPVEKRLFNDTGKLPHELKWYKLRNRKFGSQLTMDLPIMIQDIFVHDSSVVNDRSLDPDCEFMMLFNFAAEKYKQDNVTFLEEIMKDMPEG